MNRPIKFRAWDGKRMIFIEWKNGGFWFDSSSDSPKDAILMQFTGLLDKNGKEIYEGDVVEVEQPSPFLGGKKDKPKWMPSKHVVEWKENGWFPFIASWPSGSSVMRKYIKPEIIGNIYETPSILK